MGIVLTLISATAVAFNTLTREPPARPDEGRRAPQPLIVVVFTQGPWSTFPLQILCMNISLDIADAELCPRV